MSQLLTVLSGLKLIGSQDALSDLTDRLHHHVSSGLLVAFALLVSFKQFGGKPVECMVPEIFPGPWEEYAENYCFSQSTYFLPMDTASSTVSDEDKREQQINYYQWVPFILIIEAACFQLPYMVWKVLATHSGIRVHDLVSEAQEKKNLDMKVRSATIATLCTHLENALSFHRRLDKRGVLNKDCSKIMHPTYTSSYVSLMFVGCKGLFLLNAVLQFLFMNHILVSNGNHNFYGYGAIMDIVKGIPWEHTGVFPRVTLCDYEVRTIGNVQRFTMQCVLVINTLNEKIFLFLWFWYHILIIMTTLSILYWAAVLLIPYFSRAFVNKHMELCEMPFDASESSEDVRRFTGSYLHQDGMFVLRMLETHTNVIFSTDLIMALWKSFYRIEESANNMCAWDSDCSLPYGHDQQKGVERHSGLNLPDIPMWKPVAAPRYRSRSEEDAAHELPSRQQQRHQEVEQEWGGPPDHQQARGHGHPTLRMPGATLGLGAHETRSGRRSAPYPAPGPLRRRH